MKGPDGRIIMIDGDLTAILAYEEQEKDGTINKSKATHTATYSALSE